MHLALLFQSLISNLKNSNVPIFYNKMVCELHDLKIQIHGQYKTISSAEKQVF